MCDDGVDRIDNPSGHTLLKRFERPLPFDFTHLGVRSSEHVGEPRSRLFEAVCSFGHDLDSSAWAGALSVLLDIAQEKKGRRRRPTPIQSAHAGVC